MRALAALLYILAAAGAAAAAWPKWETPCEDCADGVVMGGADVVAYFDLNPHDQGIMGSPTHSVKYRGYTFYFSNSTNAIAFQNQPEKYVPAWGGFCAYGIVREGTDGSVDPKAEVRDPWPSEGWQGRPWPWNASHLGPPCDPHTGWRIVNGRLFCSLSRGIMDMFVAWGPQGVKYGDTRWANWYGELDAGPMNAGCFPGPTLEICLHFPGRYFPNRTAGNKTALASAPKPAPKPAGNATPAAPKASKLFLITDGSDGEPTDHIMSATIAGLGVFGMAGMVAVVRRWNYVPPPSDQAVE